MLTPGLASQAFRKLTVPEIIHLVRKAALKSIEWEGESHIPRGREDAALDARKRTEDAGLEIAGYGSCYRVGVSEKEQPPFEAVLETAVALQAPSIRIWAGTASPGKTESAARKSIVRKTHKLAALAAETGIALSLGFRRNTLVENSDSALRLLDEINHPNVRSVWQPPATGSGSLPGFQKLLPHLGNVYAFYPKPTASEPLAAGTEIWQNRLDLLRQSECDHHLLIARVRDDSPESLLEDAVTLRNWLEEPAKT